MKALNNYEFWFITGSQHLYGPEALDEVRANSEKVVAGMDADMPAKLVFKGLVTTPAEVKAVIEEANFNPNVAGIVTWCHTFSPSKMWISGLNLLNKPWLHLHTQFNKKIPVDTIDMDFMNLNQAAHGDREHGFIASRMKKARKVVVGHWEDKDVRAKMSGWMRSAVGVSVSKNLNVVRFGDNMRNVAVTEGDKVEAEIKLGWSVNTHPVGDLVAAMSTFTEADIDAKVAEYKEKYDFKESDLATIKHQAHQQLGMEKILKENNAGAFTNTFEDLHGLEQLSGLASQDMMANGYGYSGEGDWKTSALTHIMKEMATGLPKGTSFMEDYTYEFNDDGDDLILGAHMLEICPTIADGKAKIEVHPLGIGGKADPARLTFKAKAGDAIVASIVDMGGRLRLIVNDIECVKPYDMPKLPVAATMWKPMPDLKTSAEAWILAGGAHHSVLSFDLTAENMRDWAKMMDIEFVHINKDTTVESLEKELFFADVAWKLK